MQILYGTISDEDGKCNCKFDVPLVAVCTEYEIHHMSLIKSVDQQIKNMTSELEVFIDQWNQWEDNYSELDRNISSVITTCRIMERRNRGMEDFGMESLNKMRKDLLNFEEVLSTIKDGVPGEELLSRMENEVSMCKKRLHFAQENKMTFNSTHRTSELMIFRGTVHASSHLHDLCEP